MVDIVVNNMAWAGDHNSIEYNYLNPFRDPKYYHPFKLTSSDPDNSSCEVDVSLRVLGALCDLAHASSSSVLDR